MPELPEVETVRRGLEKLILGKKISNIEIRYPKMIKTDLNEFQKEMPGQGIQTMGRRGKYLLFYLLCGVGANAVSMLFDMGQQTHAVSVGASGAIFGVIGGLLYAVLVNRGRLEDLSSSQLIIMIIFSLYFGFTSTGVDNVAHVAGLVIGIVLAMLLYRKPKAHCTSEYWEI